MITINTYWIVAKLKKIVKNRKILKDKKFQNAD